MRFVVLDDCIAKSFALEPLHVLIHLIKIVSVYLNNPRLLLKFKQVYFFDSTSITRKDSLFSDSRCTRLTNRNQMVISKNKRKKQAT